LQNYELRDYAPTVWVSVKMDGLEKKYWEDRTSVSPAFFKLFDYISGANNMSELNYMPCIVTF